MPRRPAALAEHLRTVLFAPEEMLLVVGPPSLRRDGARPARRAARSDATRSHLATYGRALSQRNSLLRQIREGEADRDQLRLWDEPFLAVGRGDRGGAAAPPGVARGAAGGGPPRRSPRRRSRSRWPTSRTRRRSPASRRGTRWPAGCARRPRRRPGTAPRSSARTATTSSSASAAATSPRSPRAASSARRSWPSSWPSWTSSPPLDGRPPLLLLDDVFSELDPVRRGHLVRRIAELPQALVTTTVPEDLDPDLRRRAHAVAGRRGRRGRAGRGGRARERGARARGAWSDWAICCPTQPASSAWRTSSSWPRPCRLAEDRGRAHSARGRSVPARGPRAGRGHGRSRRADRGPGAAAADSGAAGRAAVGRAEPRSSASDRGEARIIATC